ncbi:DUF1642 domain-containing protein [Lacticaseibacillus rhamnosus]|uniref:DUF1642 domain-containing protein n=1 Tax=Lacticaseibacillus rhamnosus TaxID=47715 RepID=UPI001BD41B79|nr:DUF1642 domain-containing protein [Lacticaseibacillus rhamnosus]MBS9787189.1 hypothetical protein [Lacticaseibacillus rhamnosus]MCH5390522.1 DUF1642 domain-containing protein [Lacticaseibacillus rhamnosus]
MRYETKRDVFNDALAYAPVGREYEPVNDDEAGDLRSCLSAHYDAALPDDLPVIPKEVGEYIERQKKGSTLRSAIIAATDFHAVDDEEADWIFYHSDTFALAWLLGVWRVEETGEIVKLEVEK